MPQKPIIPRTCEQCGRAFLARVQEVKVGKARFCSTSCSSRALASRRETHRWWKGGRFVDRRGYVWLYRPGHPLCTPGRKGYVREHRLVLHEAGIAIPPGHAVHHVNRDKADNRRENLAVIPITEHGLLHCHDLPRT